MPSAADYFTFVSKELQSRSNLIREWFATHHPSAGTNREDLLQRVFRDIFPVRYTVSSGLAISPSGEFSKQADIFIVDGLNNRPFIDGIIPIWLIEAVYGLIEVKTYLGPAEIRDSLEKCVRFKQLIRRFADRPDQAIKDSLFVIWAYNSPTVETCLENIGNAAKSVDADCLPDFIVSPSSFVIRAGSYQCLSRYGHEGSNYRRDYELSGGKIEKRSFSASKSEDHCFMTFLIWFLSWLDRAGPRSSDLVGYLPSKEIFGMGRDGIFKK